MHDLRRYINLVEAAAPSLTEGVAENAFRGTNEDMAEVYRAIQRIGSDFAARYRNDELPAWPWRKLRDAVKKAIHHIDSHALSNGREVLAFRAELRPRDQIAGRAFDNLGGYWSFRKRSAEVMWHDNAYDRYGRDRDDLVVVLFEGNFAVSDVDWHTTMAQNIVLPGECELTPRHGAQVKITALHVGGKKYKLKKTFAIVSEATAAPLQESRDASLYHFLSANKAFDVFRTDRMLGEWEHRVPGVGTLRGNSFSRNKRLEYEGGVVRIAVDQRMLSHSNRIIPLDAQYAYDYSLGFDYKNVRDRVQNRKLRSAEGGSYDEEFVIGTIKNLHRIVRAIEVVGVMEGSSLEDDYAETMKLIELVRGYAERFGIPFSISQHVERESERARQELGEAPLREAQRLDELTRPGGKYEAQQALAKFGYRLFNDSGAYSTLLARDGDPFLVKLIGSDDRAYPFFVKLAQRHADNPHFPKFRGQLMRVTPAYFAIRVEHLQPFTGSEQLEDTIGDYLDALRAQRDGTKSANRFPASEAALRQFEQHYPKLCEALAILDREAIARGYMNDLFRGNLAMRGNVVVLLDPISNPMRGR